MNKFKTVMSFVCIFVVCGFFYACNSKETDNGYYQYPTDDSMKASKLLEVCRIPEDTLKKMSEEQLAQAVADFPLLHEVELAYSTEYGIECLASNSDAYRELLQRENAKDALIEKIKELESKSDHAALVEILKDVVINEKKFSNTFTEEEKEYLKIK